MNNLYFNKLLIIVFLIMILISPSYAYCPYDDAGNEVSKILNKKIGMNMEGGTEIISAIEKQKLSPTRLRTDLLNKIDPLSISVAKGDLIHGTNTINLQDILKFGMMPSSTGTYGPGIYSARVLEDQTAAINSALSYATGRARVTGGKPVLIRIKGYKGIESGHQTRIDLMASGRSTIPIENLEIWDPIIKQWIPATRYR